MKSASRMSPGELREYHLQERIKELEAEVARLQREIERREQERRHNHELYMILDEAHNTRCAERDDARYWTLVYKGRYVHALKFVDKDKLQDAMWFSDDPDWLKDAK